VLKRDREDQLDRSREKLQVRHRVKDEGNILHTKRRRAKWIGHVLRRNCFLKHVIGEKIEGTGRKERRYKQLLDELNETRI
jgi:hypothetical protein